MVFAEGTIFDRRPDCPDRLRDLAAPRSLPPAGRLLAVLLLLCLVPRLWLACKLPSVCDDGYYYIFVANALRDGDFTGAFEYLNLNIYPALLLLLNKLGLDWVVAGKLWGALIASLLVLPMFGWVRRMFDDRVAAVACFLYGVQPQLIEVSVEPIREATFWFLFTLCLYLLWRAISEVRLGIFALAGVVLALALHTRVEGWALLAPLVLWSVFRWRLAAHKGDRLRLVAGNACCLAITPLLLLIVNVTLLRQHTQWEFGRMHQFALVVDWLHLAEPAPPPNQNKAAATPAAAAAPVSATAPPVAATTSSLSLRTNPPETAQAATIAADGHHVRLGLLACAQIYLKDLSRALGPVSLILALIGFWNWRGIVLHRDKSALAVIGACLLLAIWIRLAMVGNINSRYFLVLLFVAIPFQSLGCLDAIAWMGRRELWRSRYKQPATAAAVGIFSLLLLAGWIDGLIAHHKERDAQIALGEYLHENFYTNSQAPPEIVADLGAARASYPIRGILPELIWPDELFTDEFDVRPPDLVIFSRDYLSEERQPAVVQRAHELGLELIDTAILPHTETPFVVLMRHRPPSRVAGYPPAQTNPLR